MSNLKEALSQTAEDRDIACRECGQRFVWTAGEQQYFRECELEPPKQCRECRDARKLAMARSSSGSLKTE